MISCIDLFCGLGGLTHGLHRGGVNVVAGIDMDSDCKFPYEANNKARFIERSVRDVSGADLLPLWKPRTHSLLAGCAPCQPFSTYSRKCRKEGQDSKWDLVADFARLIREAEPDLVTMENVPQVMDHPVFAEFTKSLIGYHCWYDVVECSDYGIPQTRKRLVFLASRFGPITMVEPPLNGELDQTTVRSAIYNLPVISAGETDPNDSMHRACRLSPLNLRRIKASAPGGTWREWDSTLIAQCHKKTTGATFPSVYGRMEWDSPAPTITTQCFGFGNGRFGHPDQHRAITLREAAMLQTFPRSYRFLPDGARVTFSVLGRMIGNAVPVRLGEVIAKSFINHIAGLSKKTRIRKS
jgi:DNA (cytosine-5)-methyltransferase 1